MDIPKEKKVSSDNISESSEDQGNMKEPQGKVEIPAERRGHGS